MVVKYKLRLCLFVVLILVGFFLLVVRLWSLQIDRHSDYVKMVRVGSELKARIPGVRGEIKDRNGVTLATNRAIFEVRINLGEMMAEYLRLVKVGQMDEAPEFEYNVPERGIMRKRTEPDVAAIFKRTIVRRLEEMGLARDFNGNSMRVHYRTFKGVVPWVYRDDLTFAEFSRFAEHNLGLPGVTVAERAVRQYPFDSLASHVLGYVKLPEDQRVSAEERAEWDYYLPDDFGGSGVEKSFDDLLRGKPGVRTMKKDERGRLVGELSFQEPRKGNDVYLTIDARIQFIAERALRDGGIGRGAVVVIDPNSGEVLALASVPSYNPNKFIPNISTEDWSGENGYLKNRVNPLFNRAVAPYAPGSTYKIPISFAGCLANIQTRRFNCAGGVTYGNKLMQCWIGQKGGAHGSLDLSDAIMRSCNCYFYQYGNTAGIDKITRVGQILGLGEKTGIELEDEHPGVLPNPQWLQVNKPLERWSAGFTANTSIGQGFVLASPLQMASVVATVANAGKSFRPHLLKRVKDGDQVVLENEPSLRADLEAEGFSKQEVELIRKGMWKVVNAPSGTAKSAIIKGVEVAGKTGTAQFWRVEKGQKIRDNHTWFISFAPYENPRFAVCVMVQGGFSGGGTAAPVATRVMEQALALDHGFDLKVQPLPESAGSFTPVTTVSYAAGAMLLTSVDEDEDLGPEREVATDITAAQPVASPSIRRDADAAGSVGAAASKKIPKAVPVRRAEIFNQGGGAGAQPRQPEAPPPEMNQRKKGLLDRLFR
jgi:penicillin-binding protein 2